MITAAFAVMIVTAAPGARAQQRTGAPASDQSAREAAPIDLTGQWVAIISEDWRWRMTTPAKGDYASIPLSAEGKRVADLWDPGRDEAAGEQCKGYGAPGVMRGPTRLRITWQDDVTLKLETDYGMQTRLLRFRGAPASAAPSWQGVTTAQWVMAAAGGRGEGRSAAGRRYGSLKTATSSLRPGYLRKNGAPYSARATYTEYWDVHQERNGEQYLVVTSVADDPRYLQIPWITSLHFKKENDPGKWDPTPCSARF
ncbi:MAG: hypothetical protein HYX77_05040 [Acidobacteria bacterium]|nr:hypothetical protein [Acidobacteriota bacterium]